MTEQEAFLDVFPDGSFTQTIERLCDEEGWELVSLDDEHGQFEPRDESAPVRNSIAKFRTPDNRAGRIFLSEDTLHVQLTSNAGFKDPSDEDPKLFVRLLRMNSYPGGHKWSAWMIGETMFICRYEEVPIQIVGDLFISRSIKAFAQELEMAESGEDLPGEQLICYIG